MMRRLIPLLAVLLLAGSAWGGTDFSTLKDGDIIFQTSVSDQSEAIHLATRSLYSHCGVILYRDGEPFVFEAASIVKFTPLQDWIAGGDGGRFAVQRLKSPGILDSKESAEKLRKAADHFLGKPYDFTFEWSDQRIYCSELVWKLFDRAFGIQIGKLRQLKDFDLSDPVVALKVKERYGSEIPLEERVVSPEGIFKSKKLMPVAM
jgi:hypothetical protein